MIQLYRMNDAEPHGVIPVDQRHAIDWNQRGHGIFWTVNAFHGSERRIENLKRIRAWAVDMDDGTKEDQRRRIEGSPLIPSLVVETKRGYQCYWAARDGCREHWNAIVLERLVPFYGADKNARDIARILRVPGFYHMKNPAEPFMVRTIHKIGAIYTERQVAERYPYVPNEPEQREEFRNETRDYRAIDGDDFWERVYNLDCESGLERLSGHHAVGGEHYTFRRNRSGTLAIFVDGKSTSCWIDCNRRIGSFDKGGPTLYQWLLWFKNSPRECAQVLKDTFPDLEVKR